MPPTYGASPHDPLQVVSEVQERTRIAIPHSLALSLQRHNISGTTLNQPSHPPTPNSPLTYGVIRLPAWEPPATGPHRTRPHYVEWNHTCNGAIIALCMWTYMVQAPNTGPATIATYPSPTRYNHQLLTANGTTRPTICETINPLPVKQLTPILQVDLLVHCQGNHQLLVELPARIGQVGTLPLKQPPVYMSMFFVL